MTSIKSQSLVLLTCGLFFMGCQDIPTMVDSDVQQSAPSAATSRAERDVWEELYDLTDSFFHFSCNEFGEVVEEGELVEMEGKIFERIAIVHDAAGGHHASWHTMPVGLKGVGVTSGEEFRVLERAHGYSNQIMSGSTGTYRQELKLTGKTTGRTFWMVFSGNYRINAEDEFIVTRDRERIECKA